MDTQSPPLTKRQRREQRRQEEAEARAQADHNRRLYRWLIFAVVIVAIGGITYWAVTASRHNGSDNINTLTTNDPYLGGANAPVVVTEFSDFSCPACAMAAPTVQELAKTYGDKIKIVFTSFVLGHRWSQKSLEAGKCAQAQGKFWEFGDLLFSKQAEWADADDALDKFTTYAGQVGLNAETFKSCLTSGATTAQIDADMAAARAKRISSTPTFYINDQKLSGALPIDQFKSVIDAELKKIQP